jgi:hypothetical protein
MCRQSVLKQIGYDMTDIKECPGKNASLHYLDQRNQAGNDDRHRHGSEPWLESHHRAESADELYVPYEITRFQQ